TLNSREQVHRRKDEVLRTAGWQDARLAAIHTTRSLPASAAQPNGKGGLHATRSPTDASLARRRHRRCASATISKLGSELADVSQPSGTAVRERRCRLARRARALSPRTGLDAPRQLSIRIASAT